MGTLNDYLVYLSRVMYNRRMTILDNRRFISEIEDFFSSKLPITLGINKKNELVRLSYEICRARNFTFSEFTQHTNIENVINGGKSGIFHRIKNLLLEIRYPSLVLKDEPRLMPIKINIKDEERGTWAGKLEPKKILVEKNISLLRWADKFIKKFSDVEVIEITNLADGSMKIPEVCAEKLYDARRDYVFLVESKAAFIKICPCTKACRRCGYWILNIGFGCPMDCSYCYLQTYSNVPGLILAANIEDYYKYLEKFDQSLTGKLRIGTGEFMDSLAFDEYTEYSTALIPFFRNMKNLVLELKTKTNKIGNVLKEEPHDNVVISWSMNTGNMAQKYEKGAPDLNERLESARAAARRGYKIGFHFDPLIYYDKWEDEYRELVEKMFSFDEIRKNTVWISLGSLRYTPGLKQTVEKRFSDNLMFYEGEFFEDGNGKMRYKKELRIEMYNKMIGWIRSLKTSAWIYLCMEPEDVWQKTLIRKKDYFFV